MSESGHEHCFRDVCDESGFAPDSGHVAALQRDVAHHDPWNTPELRPRKDNIFGQYPNCSRRMRSAKLRPGSNSMCIDRKRSTLTSSEQTERTSS